jgi:methionyl-tRNA formyltransferase
MRIGIVGRTGILLDTAKAIISSGHQVVFIQTCKAESCYDKKEDDFKLYAEELKVPFFNTLDLISHAEVIKKLNADVCVSINWLTVLKSPFLSIFPYGILNAHAGDLPRYKGNACPNWAILNFEDRVGLTIHKMSEELDSGPYILKRFLEINESTLIISDTATTIIGFFFTPTIILSI